MYKYFYPTFTAFEDFVYNFSLTLENGIYLEYPTRIDAKFAKNFKPLDEV